MFGKGRQWFVCVRTSTIRQNKKELQYNTNTNTMQWQKTFKRNIKYKSACVFLCYDRRNTTYNISNKEIQTKQMRNTNEIQTYTKKKRKSQRSDMEF